MSVKTKGLIVTRTELADIFGVAMTTVDNWVRRGLPVIQRGTKGKAWQFNTSDVASWLERRAIERTETEDFGDEKALRRRKLAAEAQKIELELARARGDLVPLNQLERALANTFAELKTNLRTVPSRVATSLIGEESETRIKSVILAEVDQALEVLGDFNLEEPDDGD